MEIVGGSSGGLLYNIVTLDPCKFPKGGEVFRVVPMAATRYNCKSILCSGYSKGVKKNKNKNKNWALLGAC